MSNLKRSPGCYRCEKPCKHQKPTVAEWKAELMEGAPLFRCNSTVIPQRADFNFNGFWAAYKRQHREVMAELAEVF